MLAPISSALVATIMTFLLTCSDAAETALAREAAWLELALIAALTLVNSPAELDIDCAFTPTSSSTRCTWASLSRRSRNSLASALVEGISLDVESGVMAEAWRAPRAMARELGGNDFGAKRSDSRSA